MSEQTDILACLMSRYPQEPEWWYMVIFVSMRVIGNMSTEVWPMQFHVWAFIHLIIFVFVYIVPVGIIWALTNQQIELR